ncbi:9616_t:CDS:10 [Entrophospora sp. SA101]|nr:9616_t:CDS:10 [Entrophospora sp. SA101]
MRDIIFDGKVQQMVFPDDTGKPGSQLSGKGNATFYDPNVAISACGQQHYDNELIGAMNKEQYGKFANSDESPVCGICIKVTGPKGNDTGKPGSQLSGKGNATFYDPNVAISACGQQHYDNELIGAMNKEQYGKFANSDESPVCGICIKVTGPKGSVKWLKLKDIVPKMICLFLSKTNNVCKMELKNIANIPSNLSMLSMTMTLNADFEYPTILSGEINFIKGNSDVIAIVAANAVLPLLEAEH